MEEIKSKLAELLERLRQIAAKLDPETKQLRLSSLEVQTTAPDFWQHEANAKKIMQEIGGLRDELTSLSSLETDIKEQLEFIALAESEPKLSTELITDLQNKTAQLVSKVERLETKLFLSGEYDDHNAILSIHAGQGGTEAMDWAQMLLRMYLKFIETEGWSYQLVSESIGEEAGIKQTTLLIEARHAYGLLKHEQGTHRLVRLSPFNADNLRQTSFALVEVLPELDEADAAVEIPEDELEWDFFRSSGKGGQNVNKVSTAVRLRHKPSGLVVECQTQRSQVQNRKFALSLLTAKLWEQQKAAEAEKLDAIKGGYTPASWGTQIRNYVLHPYQLVKDLRTGVETSDTTGVLNGKLEEFIKAEIKLSTN